MIKIKFLRNRKFKLLLVNLSVFIIIFSIFALIIFHYVRHTQFTKIDKDLLRAEDSIKRSQKRSSILQEPFYDGNQIYKLGPGIIPIIRKSDGTSMTTTNNMYSFINDNEEALKPVILNEIYSINIKNTYFRALAFSLNDGNDSVVVQLLIISNGEVNVLSNLLRILVIGGIIIIFISVFASYFLAKKSMEPVLIAWQKQKQFVEDASHEMRTPLTIVQTKLELMLREPNAKIIDKYDYIAPALSETGRLSRLVGNLLTLARADSNVTELDKSTIDVNSLISRVSEPYIELGEIENKSIFLNLDKNFSIFCDKDRIHQLLVILLDNALKYTAEGGVIFINSFIKDNKWILEVIDNGIGIKEENLNKIFERFFREDKARSRETGGSGLGLSIAKWIVEKHQGTIRALRNDPKGTIIEVKIPIKNSNKQ